MHAAFMLRHCAVEAMEVSTMGNRFMRTVPGAAVFMYGRVGVGCTAYSDGHLTVDLAANTLQLPRSTAHTSAPSTTTA